MSFQAQSSQNDGNAGWLRVCGAESPDLESELSQQSAQRIAAGKYSLEDCKYIRALSLSAVKGSLRVSDQQLEKLRRLCQLWDVDMRPKEISSHRKFIGPIIIASKRLLFPILRTFLKDFFRQQRAFNAASISLLADLASESKQSPGSEIPPAINRPVI